MVPRIPADTLSFACTLFHFCAVFFNLCISAEPATMRTPLALAFFDNWKKGFDQGPDSRTRNVYGGSNWAENVRKVGGDNLRKFADDPEIVILDIVNGVTVDSPKTRYRCGLAAKTIFPALAMLPDGARDKFLYKMLFPGSLPTTDAVSRETTRSSDVGVVLITGCDSGFGKLIAVELIKRGFVVVCSCLTAEGRASLPPDAVGFDGDLTDSSKLQSLVSLTESTVNAANECRYFHALVNNAGVCLPANLEWASFESFSKTFEVNFFLPVELTYSLLPLLKQSRGRVVNVSSIAGFLAPLPSLGSYCCSKHALTAYTDTLRCEVEPLGVRVINIEPALMKTPLSVLAPMAWQKSFDEGPDSRTNDVYGTAWAEKARKRAEDNLKNSAQDPHVTASDIVKAVTLSNPPSKFKSGWRAKYFFPLVAIIPDKLRDWLTYHAQFPKIAAKADHDTI